MNDQPGTCAYEWVDGWWGEHRCSLPAGHDDDLHRCHCDITTPEWRDTL